MEMMPSQPETHSLVSAGPAAEAAQPVRSNTLTIAQFVSSGLGIVFSLLVAGLLFVAGLVSLFSQSSTFSETAVVFGMAWVGLFVALLCLPSLALSLLRLTGKSFGLSFLQRLPRATSFATASILLFLWPLVLLLGDRITQNQDLVWLLLPPLQILAIGIPVWWLFELARRNLSIGSGQRGWGVLNFSMLITTPVVVFVEIIAILFLAILAILWFSSRPDLVSELEKLALRLSTINREDQEMILEMLKPILQNPVTIFTILALVAGLIPLIEELLKPLAIWLLAGRRLTPAEGFVAGALCGAAFALLESLISFNGIGQAGWAALAIGRSGTALLHITTTSLVGWAMALAWQRDSYGRLALAYLLATLLHGLWNGLSILGGLSAILDEGFLGSGFFNGLVKIAPAGIFILTFILFVLLWGNNQRLQRAVQSEAITAVPPQPFS